MVADMFNADNVTNFLLLDAHLWIGQANQC